MCQLDELKKHRGQIYKIAKKRKAKTIYVFGSCARKEETPESDVDFLVEFQDGVIIIRPCRSDQRSIRFFEASCGCDLFTGGQKKRQF